MPGRHGPALLDPAQVESGGAADVLAALSKVYEATLEADPWPRIMAALGGLVCSSKGTYIRVDRTYPSESETVTWGIAPEFEQPLRTRNLDEDRLWRSLLPMPAGSVFRASDVIPANLYRSWPLYESVGRPAGLEHCIGAILDNTPQYFSNVCFMRASTDFRACDKEVLTTLVPHLQAALRIGRRISLGDAGRREALLSFDRAHQPLIVLDRSGYAIYTNSSAARVLAQADGVELKFGRFIFQSIPTQTEFERLVRLAVAAAHSDIQPVPHEIRVPRRGPGSPYAMSVIPVSRPSDRAVLPDGAGCLVLVFDLEVPNPLPLERLAWLYRLTQAEVRVCEALFRVGAVDAVAEDLSLTRNTVRSHLKSIYSKFGIATQGQLMQRLANSIRLSDGIDRNRAG